MSRVKVRAQDAGNTAADATEYLARLAALLCAALVTWGGLAIVAEFYRPTVDLDAIARLFCRPLGEFAPEPLERTLFLMAIVVAPLVLFFSQKFFGRYFSRPKLATLLARIDAPVACVVAIAIGFLIYIDWKAVDFFVLETALFRNGSLFGLLLGTAACYRMLVMNDRYVALRQSLDWSLLAVGFAAVISVGLYCIYGIKAVKDEPIFFFHFNPVFHAVSQVHLGKEMLVDFSHGYGLYPHILAPLFQLTGLNVLKFTVTMGVLTTLSAGLVYLALLERCQSRIIASLGFLASIYASNFYGHVQPPYDPYFQYFPVRILFPSLALFLVHRYLRTPNRGLYRLNFALFTVGLFWNFDTGFVVFFSWLLTLAFIAWQERDYRKITGHLRDAVVSFASGLFLFTLALWIFYGHLPDYLMNFTIQKICIVYGYYMLPMPLLGPWNLVVLLYAVAMLAAFSVRKRQWTQDGQSAYYLFLALLGVGLFSYYQGRSHVYNLASSCTPALVIMTLLADDALMECRNGQGLRPRLLLGGILFCLVFSGVSLVKNVDVIATIIRDRWHDTRATEGSVISRTADFLKGHLHQGEAVLILSHHSGVYHQETRTTSPLQLPSLNELFFQSDLERLRSYVGAPSTTRLILDRNSSYTGDLPLDGYFIEQISPDGNVAILRRAGP